MPIFRKLIFATILLAPLSASALNIEEKLADPTQEQHAQEVFKSLRCMVCSGESIADSRAELAKDLRLLVREKVKEGYTEAQVLNYVSSRYGEDVLMQPPFKPNTYLLWLGPVLMLSGGLLIMFFALKKKS